ncbi:hypothetical protein BJ165DRAFT_442831 [Panaeolus papilionaceus]|nr:hypothetical protein BJ165DRAFT_442831 [Panaeolus papilionaceus]
MNMTPHNQKAHEQTMLVFDANATLGAIQIGVMISLFLFGLVTAQVYIYMNKFPNDPWILKCLVPIVWFLELGHTISVCHALYIITVTQYGRPQLLVVPPVSLDAAILFSGFIGPIEQCWFAYRVYRFSGRLFVPSCCTVLAFARWFGSTSLAIVAFHKLTIKDYIARWSWLITAIVVVGACGDCILAASLCYYLNKWKEIGLQRTSKLIKQLMLSSIETGLLTSMGAIALLVCYLTMKDNFVWIGIFTILARLFSNSFLASLNARSRLGHLYDQDMQVNVSMGSTTSAGSQVRPSSPPFHSPQSRFIHNSHLANRMDDILLNSRMYIPHDQ